MLTFHLIRPWFLSGWLLALYWLWRGKQRANTTHSWETFCDPALFAALMKHQVTTQRPLQSRWLIGCFACLCLAASGPAWHRLPTPTYHMPTPKLILLNLSDHMALGDLSPSRVQRALFAITDLLKQPNSTPIGLCVYTSEPFVVSPLTEDAHTIEALLPSLNPHIVPVDGDDLALALQEGSALLQQAHYSNGALLVLTSTPPDQAAEKTAAQLAQQGFSVSILPVASTPFITPAFHAFAMQGKGMQLSLDSLASDLQQWLANPARPQSLQQTKTQITQWQDEGRWFMLPACGLLLPVFRRGWLRRQV